MDRVEVCNALETAAKALYERFEATGLHAFRDAAEDYRQAKRLVLSLPENGDVEHPVRTEVGVLEEGLRENPFATLPFPEACERILEAVRELGDNAYKTTIYEALRKQSKLAGIMYPLMVSRLQEMVAAGILRTYMKRSPDKHVYYEEVPR